MPAWSVPGSQSTSLPSMRALRLRMSWMVLFSTCPMWSMPVTFGGGMTMENAGLMDFAFAVKHELSCQNFYHLSSTACGSYAFDISDMLKFLVFATVNAPTAINASVGDTNNLA